MTVQDEAVSQGINLTDAAAAKVGSLLEQEGRDDLRLRIAVQPGGCSGLRYQLAVGSMAGSNLLSSTNVASSFNVGSRQVAPLRLRAAQY